MVSMNKAVAVVNLAAALAAGTLVYAAVDNVPRTARMAENDLREALEQIENDARVSSVVCKRLTGPEKTVCDAELGAEKKVRVAELEARYLGTVQARHSARLTRIQAQFEVDAARCAAFSGEARGDCETIAARLRDTLFDEARVPA